jgi:MFS family permease
LLPVISKQDLGLDSTGYGIVLGSLGLGAVLGALFLPRLRRSLSVDRLTAWASLVFALATIAVAYLRFVPLVALSTAAGGFAWLAMLSTLGVVVQTAAPAWVRARALGIYLLVFQGTLAVGSFAWGAVAERFGTGTALSGAALVLIVGLAATLRWPLHVVQNLNFSPSMHWPDPEVALSPDHEDGPVLISIDYRVSADQSRDFVKVMDSMRTFRRREGAISWGLFRDAADPDHYVETFLVLTWAEHMRQHARVTVEDQVLEDRRNSFLQQGVAPVTYHLIDAHAFDGKAPEKPIDAVLPQ